MALSQQDYFVKQGESTDAYNTRIAGLRAAQTGGLPSVPQSSLTPQGFQQANQAITTSTTPRQTTQDNVSYLNNFTNTASTTPYGSQFQAPNINQQQTQTQTQQTPTKPAQTPTAPTPSPALTGTPTTQAGKTAQDEINRLLSDPNVMKGLPPELLKQISDTNNAATQNQAMANQAQNYLSQGNYTGFNELVEQMKESQKANDKRLTDMVSAFAPLREKYLASLTPTAQEQEFQNQLVDIRKRQADFQLSREQGVQGEYGLGRPLALSTGRAQELTRQSQFQEQALRNEENLILNRLGIAQGNRELTAKVLEKGLDFAMKDFDIANKIYEASQQQQQQVFDNALKLDQVQRQAFADLLDQMKGVDPSKLTAQDEAVLAQAAASRGISYSLLKQGIQADYDDAIIKRKGEALGLQEKQLGLLKTQAEIQKLRAEAQGAGLTPDNLLAYAQEYASSGKIPTGLPKGTFGAVSQVAKELPKQSGAIVDRNTGIKSNSVSDSLQGGYASLYSTIELAKELKELDKKRWGGVIAGTLGKVFGSTDQQRYVDLRDQISDLLARARTGAAINSTEEDRYFKLLPGRFDEPLFLGADSQVRIDNFIHNLTEDLQNKLDTQGLAIYGLSKVDIGGREFNVGDIIENESGQKGRVNADGSITIL